MKDSVILARLRVLRRATRELRSTATTKKNAVLKKTAALLSQNLEKILKANRQDLKEFERSTQKKISPAFRDRLTLNPERILQMVESLNQVAKLPDPVGESVEESQLKSGLHLKRVRSPLGVILMIFESRPNVAIEAFSLGFKAGNGMILRGGRESNHTVKVLYQLLGDALESEGISKAVLWGITDTDRKIVQFLLKQKKWIDVVVPRGGDALIEFVTEESRIPIIKNDRGVCHAYVHKDADPEMAVQIILNAKTQRPGVCNALETVLIHEKIAEDILPVLFSKMIPIGVKWNVCPKSYSILKGRKSSPDNTASIKKATQKSWDKEYLDLEVNCRVVSSLEEAIVHIENHSSRHSECIVTRSAQAASQFQKEIDSAVVYWNASTRFTDGFEFGLGGELGISTQKLHVRGPVGLKELTSTRWVVDGQGQIRR